MEQDELDTHVEGARALLADEAARGGQPTVGPSEPAGPTVVFVKKKCT
jgi:hypothetical protein